MTSRIVTCRLEITSELPDNLGRIPFSPIIDFGELIARAGLSGVLDPDSIEVIDLASGEPVRFGRTEDLAHGDRGRIEWAIEDPTHRRYRLRFAVVTGRPPLHPQRQAPLVGVGDLLRYNAGEPRPLSLYSMRLVDLTGDGRADLAGTWNYYHRPGSPISGVVCYPRVANREREFGDLVHLQFREEPGGPLLDFPGTYVDADFADLNGDGLVDLVFTERGRGEVTFFLNTGERTPAGLPVFSRGPSLSVPALDLGNLSLVDLDHDGVLDLVVEGWYVRNLNPRGWPFESAEPVNLGAGPRVAFLDLDDDGRLDLVGLADPEDATRPPEESVSYVGYTPCWRPREPGEKVVFGEARPLAGLPPLCSRVAAAVDPESGSGLLVQDDVLQWLRFFTATPGPAGPVFQPQWRAESVAAVLSLSDQAWPCLCDWDGDGGRDLLVGGGYGWPRIVRDLGGRSAPAWAEAELIPAQRSGTGKVDEGEPIRLLRDDLLHSRHWHNMGYPYPVLVDWDGDGLPDLMLPNETNRIVWHRNEGTRAAPRFGPRQFLEVDGHPDSEVARAESGRLAEDRNLPNHPYPTDPRSPFWWRTGAAFADWNGDGMIDLITHSWERRATLFVQYLDATGTRRLREAGPVRLVDGRCIDDSIIERPMHWTESFRAVDWDGDGLLDLVYSLAGTGAIYLLRNVGTREAPVFDLPRRFCCYGKPLAFTVHGPNVWAGDLNDDGKPDLIGCVEWSVYPFFAHAALEMPEHPGYQITLAAT